MTYPEIDSEIPKPIAVVMDLGKSVAICSAGSLKKNPIKRMLPRELIVPRRTAQKTALKLFFNKENCLYRGIARHTVAGVRK